MTLRLLPRRRRGAASIEYGLVLGLIAVVLLISINMLGLSTGCLMERAAIAVFGDDGTADTSSCDAAGTPVAGGGTGNGSSGGSSGGGGGSGGGSASLAVSPTAASGVNYASPGPGQTASFTVSNSGNAEATLSAASVSGDYTLASSSCGGTLAAGASCGFVVQAQASGNGALSGSATLGSGISVSLSGTASGFDAPYTCGAMEEMMGPDPASGGVALGSVNEGTIEANNTAANDLCHSYAVANQTEGVCLRSANDVRFYPDAALGNYEDDGASGSFCHIGN